MNVRIPSDNGMLNRMKTIVIGEKSLVKAIDIGTVPLYAVTGIDGKSSAEFYIASSEAAGDFFAREGITPKDTQ